MKQKQIKTQPVKKQATINKKDQQQDDFKQAACKLFQEFEVDHDEDIQVIEIPEDRLLGPIAIIQINYQRIQDQQRKKPQKTQIQCLLEQGRQQNLKLRIMSQLEKLVNEVETIENDAEATLEEVYCIPATSEILLEKIEAFEYKEIMNEKIITLLEIVGGQLHVSPDIFCENFNIDELQEISKQPHLDANLSSQLKGCLQAQKKLLNVNKRHQYITEKLSNEIETILNFTEITTKEIQVFRGKVQHLRCVVSAQHLDEQQIKEYLIVAETIKLDQKVQQSLRSQLQRLRLEEEEHQQQSDHQIQEEIKDENQGFLEEYKILNRYPIEIALNQVTVDRQDSRQFLHQIIRLIRKGFTQPLEYTQQLNCLYLLYLQIIWVMKADQMLKRKVQTGTLMTLLNYAKVLKLSDGVELKSAVLKRLQLHDQLQIQINEYLMQRDLWRQDRQAQIQNLKNVRQQLIYVKNKPSYEHVRSIVEQSQWVHGLQIQVLVGDLQSVDQIVKKFEVFLLHQDDSPQQQIITLKDVKKSMLYSFLKIDQLATQVCYFITKHSLMKTINSSGDFSTIQRKMADLQTISELDAFLSKKLNFPFDDQEKSNDVTPNLPLTQLFQQESFDWVQSIRDGLEIDFIAVSIQERIQTSFEKVTSLEHSENITLDSDRVALREQYCVNFTELDDFVTNKLSKVRFQSANDLDFIVQQHQGAKKLRNEFVEMGDRLKEFQLKLELEQLEALIDNYLEGGVCLFIEEMKTLMQYTSMARTFWGEVLDKKDMMKHQVLDSKRNKQIHEFLQTFTQTLKKFNVEIPEVKKFAEEYFEVLGILEGMNNQLEPKQIKQILEKKVPRHLRCLDMYVKCQVDAWCHVVSSFLGDGVWTISRLVEELLEGYNLLDQVISKSLQFGDMQEEMPRSVDKIKPLIIQLEELYDGDNNNGKLDTSEKCSIDFSVRRPFDNPSDYCQQVRQRNFSRNKSQSLGKKRDAAQLRVKPKGSITKVMKIISQSKKIKKPIKKKPLNKDVTEQLRSDKKTQLTIIMKRNHVFSHQPIEQRVKVMESQVFGDYHDRRKQYDKEFDTLSRLFKVIEPLQQISKRLIMKEFNMAEIRKYCTQIHQLSRIDEQLQKKKSKITQISSYTINKAPKKQQNHLVEQILRQQRMKTIQVYPTLVPQTFRKDDDLETIKKIKMDDSIQSPILYNPETGIETKQGLTDVSMLGYLNIKMNDHLHKKKINFKFQMLTTDEHSKIILFPENLLQDLSVYQKATCPASQVVEYINLHKSHETFKYIKGWLYSTNLEEAQEIEKLALQLKDQRLSIGTKCFDNSICLSLLHVDQCAKISNFPTKWIIPTPLAQDESYLSKLDDYQKLYLLKPQIGFYLYIKDFKVYSQYFEKLQMNKGGLKGIPFSYTLVHKIHQLNQIINSQREMQRSTRESNKLGQTPLPEFSTHSNYFDVYQGKYEPISDDEELMISQEYKMQALKVLNKPDESKNGLGFYSLILKEVPNILNLLKNDDDGEQD